MSMGEVNLANLVILYEIELYFNGRMCDSAVYQFDIKEHSALTEQRLMSNLHLFSHYLLAFMSLQNHMLFISEES